MFRRRAALVALLCVTVLLPVPAAADSDVVVQRLEVEAAVEPIGIDAPAPRLSWQLASARRGVRQTAWQVRVASSSESLAAGEADIWDSGRVEGDVPWTEYAGPALASRSRYHWDVRVWDEGGEPSPWSSPSTFETAFMDPDEWQAEWIKGPLESCADDGQRNCPAPLLRTEFDLPHDVASARLYASGLAYGVFALNGQRVGEAVLDPGITDYTERVFYVTHDVTALLQRGRNALGVELGRGFMGMVGPTFQGYPGAWRSEPVLRLELHVDLADGSEVIVRSDGTWRTAHGPRLFDDVMRGESFDARLAQEVEGWTAAGFDDSGWQSASIVGGPSGVAVAQDQEPIRPTESLPFRTVEESAPGVWLFDLGQNVAGNAVLDLDLAEGQQITLHYGEKLTDDRRVDVSGHPDFSGGTVQVDTYVGGEGPDRWRPEFTYKGFQYVEVTGLTEPPPVTALTAEVWHSDVPPVGTWESSDDLVNRVVANTRRAIVSNLHSHPTDTPIYEKSGYTGDAQIMAASMAYLFDMQQFLSKWSVDLSQALTDTAGGPSGQPMRWVAPSPEVEPVAEGSPVTPGWDAAMFVVPDVVAQHYGDARPTDRALPAMARYLEHIDQYAASGTITGMEVPEPMASRSTFGLGDWSNPCQNRVDPFTCVQDPLDPRKGVSVDSTAWYHEMLRIYAAAAEDAGDVDAADGARARAEQVRAAFDLRFHNPVTGAYADATGTDVTGSQGVFSQHVNAIALGLGVALPERRDAAGAALAADVVARGGHNYSGIMGTRFIWDALTSTGHLDAAWTAATQTAYPSYGYWIEELGWTSLGEHWEADTRSRNHHMFGTVVQWLFEDIAGYRPASPGFAAIEVEPHLPDGLDWVSASTDTVRGRVSTCWERTGDGLALDVTVPAGSTATVRLPWSDGESVVEVGTGAVVPAGSADGIVSVATDGDRLVYEIGSGTYAFRAGDAAEATLAHCGRSAGASVERLAGPERVATAVAISQTVFPDGAPLAVVATAEDFPDALAAGPLAAVLRGPLLLTGHTSLSAATAQELRRLGVGEIVVAGGPAAVPDAVAAELEQIAPTRRLAGADRFATAAAIGEALGAERADEADVAYVATGGAFPDALSAGAAAVADGAPVLLTEVSSVPEPTLAALESLSPTRIVLVGGSDAADAAVEARLADVATVERLAGADRFATAAAVAAATFDGPGGTVLLATGAAFPDALAGVAATGVLGAPILLVQPDAVPDVTAVETVRLAPSRIVVLGGTAAVSDAVIDAVTALGPGGQTPG